MQFVAAVEPTCEKPPLNQDGTDYDGNYWRYVDNVPTPWVLKEEI